MSMVEERLRAAGMEVPPLRPKAGQYLGWVQTGDLLFLSGQGADGRVGRLGAGLDVAAGRVAARECMLNLLAQARSAVGSLERIGRIVKVLGFVACTEDFRDTPQVIDGASLVLQTAFGPERGAHARAAVGVQALPMGFAVEIEMVAEVRKGFE
jgi:enamine deaminase RidA (YjgF/YER057c/UK114 family)